MLRFTVTTFKTKNVMTLLVFQTRTSPSAPTCVHPSACVENVKRFFYFISAAVGSKMKSAVLHVINSWCNPTQNLIKTILICIPKMNLCPKVVSQLLIMVWDSICALQNYDNALKYWCDAMLEKNMLIICWTIRKISLNYWEKDPYLRPLKSSNVHLICVTLMFLMLCSREPLKYRVIELDMQSYVGSVVFPVVARLTQST